MTPTLSNKWLPITCIGSCMFLVSNTTITLLWSQQARWCLSSNFKHEANRQSLFDAGVPRSLVASLSNLSPEPHKGRLIATLKALKTFTLDDDIRAEFGKAHENCRFLVEEEGLIEVALKIIKGIYVLANSSYLDCIRIFSIPTAGKPIVILIPALAI